MMFDDGADEKKITIEPLPDQSGLGSAPKAPLPDDEPAAAKLARKKPGRKNEGKTARKTKDSYTMTPAREAALKKMKEGAARYRAKKRAEKEQLAALARSPDDAKNAPLETPAPKGPPIVMEEAHEEDTEADVAAQKDPETSSEGAPSAPATPEVDVHAQIGALQNQIELMTAKITDLMKVGTFTTHSNAGAVPAPTELRQRDIMAPTDSFMFAENGGTEHYTRMDPEMRNFAPPQPDIRWQRPEIMFF